MHSDDTLGHDDGPDGGAKMIGCALLCIAVAFGIGLGLALAAAFSAWPVH